MNRYITRTVIRIPTYLKPSDEHVLAEFLVDCDPRTQKKKTESLIKNIMNRSIVTPESVIMIQITEPFEQRTLVYELCLSTNHPHPAS